MTKKAMRYKQFDDLVISDFEVDVWQHPWHNHNHFELIYIAKGAGVHQLNERSLPYKKGCLYLLGPEDEHEFEIKKSTRFLYLKFTRHYLTAAEEGSTAGAWSHDIDSLLFGPARKEGSLLTAVQDQWLVEQLMQIIMQEHVKKQRLHRRIIDQLFAVLILVINRNRKRLAPLDVPDDKTGIAEALMEYIELNIYSPPKLTLQALSRRFHYSTNYIGLLFKEKVGVSLRQYISDFRYALLAERLHDSQVAVKQVVSEFGFVDESHLHKFIHGKTGKRLVDLRRNQSPDVV